MKRIIMIGVWVCILYSGPASAKPWTIGFLTGVEKGIQSGFIQMASQGVYKAKQEHNFKVITETPDDVSQESMALAFRKLIEKQPDLIIATGYQMAEHVMEFAPRYPKILFLMIDVPIENMPNVMSVQFAAHEGSFLVGALAGWMTKTGTVGAIMGVDVPPVLAFFVGFKEGVHYANPDVHVQEAFLSKMPDFSGFISPEKGEELAGKWYGQDVDIIFSLAGTSGNGIIHQAQKEQKYVIGVDVDQDAMAKGYVLTSMMKRVDVAVYLAISQIVTGGFQPGSTCYGLKENGVGLTDMIYTKHLIPEDVLKNVKEAERKIISGELIVTDYLKQQ